MLKKQIQNFVVNYIKRSMSHHDTDRRDAVCAAISDGMSIVTSNLSVVVDAVGGYKGTHCISCNSKDIVANGADYGSIKTCVVSMHCCACGQS